MNFIQDVTKNETIFYRIWDENSSYFIFANSQLHFTISY